MRANVTASLTRSPQSRQGRCILEGADDADVIRGFDRLDALVARHVDELPGVLQKASQKAYRETRRYRTLQCKNCSPYMAGSESLGDFSTEKTEF